MSTIPAAAATESSSSALDIRYGRDPYLDAWILHFMSENNIEYTIDPAKNASPEQLRFMVSLEPDQVYVPAHSLPAHETIKHHFPDPKRPGRSQP